MLLTPMTTDLTLTLFPFNLQRTLNETLEKDLQAAAATDGHVGGIFVSFSPYFKMYSVYLNNYDHALAMVVKLKKNVRIISRCTKHDYTATIMNFSILSPIVAQNRKFQAFIAEAEKQPRCRGLTLQDFLIMPAQRIPRYKMLIQELLKHTPNYHPDHANLEEAFKEVAKTARANNEKMKHHDRVGTVQSPSDNPAIYFVYLTKCDFFISMYIAG